MGAPGGRGRAHERAMPVRSSPENEKSFFFMIFFLPALDKTVLFPYNQYIQNDFVYNDFI